MKNRRRALSILAAVAATLVAAAPASAAEQNAYAGGMSYATPAVNVGQGDTLAFHNLDQLAQHDLVGQDGSFGSRLIGGGQSAPVEGVEKLSQGAYQFHCTLHSWMQGTLNVSAAGGVPGAPSTSGGTPGAGNAAPDPMDIWPNASKRPLSGGDWPFYGKDLGNSRDGGKNGPSVTEAANLGPAWSHHSSDGDFTGTPIVSHGMVIAAARGGTVFAIDAVTGKTKWHRDLIGKADEGKGTAINASVAVYRNRIYVPVVEIGRPRLVALTLTGKVRFDTPIGDQPMMDTYGSPAASGGRIFMGTSGYFGELSSETKARGTVVAVHWKTGKLLWRTFTVPEGHDGGSVWSTPAVDVKRRKLYVGSGNAYHEPAGDMTDSMLQLDPRNGRILKHFQATAGDVWNGPDDWPENPDADFGASPNLIEGEDGRALVGQGQKSGRYWAVDRNTMEPVWSALTGPGTFTGGIVGSTAYDGNRVYGPDTHAGESWAVDRGGRLSWVSADGGPLHFNATSTANGVVYTTDMSGSLIAREASTGAILTKIPLGSPSWAGVSIAGGSVFTATGSQSAEGWLVSYRPRTGNEANEAREHWEEEPSPAFEPEEGEGTEPRRCKNHRHSSGRNHKHCKKPAGQGDEGGEAGGQHTEGEPGGPLHPIKQRSDRYVPKPPGTRERLTFYYGPYTVPSGHDMNRIDLELPMHDGWLESIEPAMRRVTDLSEPSHQEGHIHHAHWFALDPGNQEDNYFKNNAEWIFGNGDEESRGDFRERSAADPKGPNYGQFIGRGKEQTVIYMLHNKTARPLEVYIALDVAFKHGTREQIEAVEDREQHDVSGILFGSTYNVPRDRSGDGVHEYTTETGKVVEWTSTVDGTIIGMGGHLHPGGLNVKVENYGSNESPCPRKGPGYGGTLLLDSDVIHHNAPLSEDYQTEVTHPGWRAPIRKGDRLRLSATYENKDHAWYDVMQHVGIYVDEEQPPRGRCNGRVINDRRWKKKPWMGVPNRSWGKHEDPYCGEAFGAPPCEKPEQGEPPAQVRTNHVEIANFAYVPGDRSASGVINSIPVVKRGQSLTFVNADQAANIRHTVTTCPWPCNGKYVGNYPLADGAWDSSTLGYDLIDGGNPNPVAQTPPDLPAGTYSYFCRVHPFMRGAFKVEE